MKYVKESIRIKNYHVGEVNGMIAPKFEDAVSMIKEMTGDHPIEMFGPDFQNALDEMEYDAEKRQGEEV